MDVVTEEKPRRVVVLWYVLSFVATAIAGAAFVYGLIRLQLGGW